MSIHCVEIIHRSTATSRQIRDILDHDDQHRYLAIAYLLLWDVSRLLTEDLHAIVSVLSIFIIQKFRRSPHTLQEYLEEVIETAPRLTRGVVYYLREVQRGDITLLLRRNGLRVRMQDFAREE